MLKCNVIANGLNSRASRMVSSLYRKSSDAEKHIGEFLRYANDNNIQGPALVSFYSKVQGVSKRIFPEPKLNIADVISDKVLKNKKLQDEADEFVSTLLENYPKTLRDRISLACQGCVDANEVKPQSKFRKFFVILNKMIREE